MEAKVINLINTKRQDPEWLLSVAGLEADTFGNFLDFIYDGEASKENICANAFGKEAWDLAEEQVRAEEILVIKTDKKLARREQKLVNRGLWSPVTHMQAFARQSGDGAGTVRWYAKSDLDAPGLAVRMLEYYGVALDAPVVMNVENRLPNYIRDNGSEGPQYQVPQSEVQNFWEEGWLYSAGKTVWNVSNTPIGRTIRSWLGECLPTDIDLSSYNRRFRAALVKDGYIPGIRVRTATQYVTDSGGFVMHQGVDGSGLYDPFHPDMADLMARFGAVALQITICYVNGEIRIFADDEVLPTDGDYGLLWKGLIIPRAGINLNLPEDQKAAIHLDHLQVKGRHKKRFKNLFKAATGPTDFTISGKQVQVEGEEEPREVLDVHELVAEALNIAENDVVVTNGAHVGVMKAKARLGNVSSCFELLEQLGSQFHGANDLDAYLRACALIKRIITKYVTIEMDRLKELGPNGLLGRATRDDPKLKRLAMFLKEANSKLKGMGAAQISPLDVPMLAGKLESSMRQALWVPANGGGLGGKYPFAVIDNTLQPGTCVMANVKPGTEVAVFRLPCVLAQGLTTLKVVKPSDHHVVVNEGEVETKYKYVQRRCPKTRTWSGPGNLQKRHPGLLKTWKEDGIWHRLVEDTVEILENIVPNVIFMHEQDIVVRMQGDDDGDEVGVSTDPDMVELFKLRRDQNIYHIEPESEKRTMRCRNTGKQVPIPAFSRKGRKYIGIDQTGPVGIVTIWMAGLNAVGAHDVATAFAVGVQEAIDSQKNIVRFTDPNRARYLSNWYKDDLGQYHIHHKENGEDNFLSEKAEDEFPLDTYKKLYEDTLIEHGCWRQRKINGKLKVVAGNPLGWRVQERVRPDGSTEKLKKAIAFRNFKESRSKQDGDHGNWVHFAHDEVRRQWKRLEEQWTSKDPLPTKELLGKILHNAGINIETPVVDWSSYHEGLRERAGLNWYGQSMKKLLSKKKYEGNNEDSVAAKTARIDRMRDELDIRMAKLSKEELFSIWLHENTPTWMYKHPVVKSRSVYVDEKGAEDAKSKAIKVVQVNNPNYAFTAVASGRSAIMEALGVKLKSRCNFLHQGELNKETGLSHFSERVVRFLFSGKYGNAYESLTYLMKNETQHTANVKDENGKAVPLHACKDCCEDLSTLLVREIRERKRVTETAGANALVSAMNRKEQQVLGGWNRMVAIKARAEKQDERLQQMRDEDDQYENWL